MFEILIFFITVIFTAYVFTKKSDLEKFQTSSSVTNVSSTTSSSVPTTESVISTTSSKNLDDMEEIDFSLLNDYERNRRDKNSRKLQNCLSKFSNNQRHVLRDVAELMNKKDDYLNESTNNIYSKTNVVGSRLNQLTFW